MALEHSDGVTEDADVRVVIVVVEVGREWREQRLDAQKLRLV